MLSSLRNWACNELRCKSLSEPCRHTLVDSLRPTHSSGQRFLSTSSLIPSPLSSFRQSSTSSSHSIASPNTSRMNISNNYESSCNNVSGSKSNSNSITANRRHIASTDCRENLTNTSPERVTQGIVDILGQEALDSLVAGGVVHVTAVVPYQGYMRTLKIKQDSPKSDTDWFILNMVRAAADGLLITAKTLREEPNCVPFLHGPYQESLKGWRSKELYRLGLRQPIAPSPHRRLQQQEKDRKRVGGNGGRGPELEWEQEVQHSHPHCCVMTESGNLNFSHGYFQVCRRVVSENWSSAEIEISSSSNMPVISIYSNLTVIEKLKGEALHVAEEFITSTSPPAPDHHDFNFSSFSSSFSSHHQYHHRVSRVLVQYHSTIESNGRTDYKDQSAKVNVVDLYLVTPILSPPATPSDHLIPSPSSIEGALAFLTSFCSSYGDMSTVNIPLLQAKQDPHCLKDDVKSRDNISMTGGNSSSRVPLIAIEAGSSATQGLYSSTSSSSSSSLSSSKAPEPLPDNKQHCPVDMLLLSQYLGFQQDQTCDNNGRDGNIEQFLCETKQDPSDLSKHFSVPSSSSALVEEEQGDLWEFQFFSTEIYQRWRQRWRQRLLHNLNDVKNDDDDAYEKEKPEK